MKPRKPLAARKSRPKTEQDSGKRSCTPTRRDFLRTAAGAGLALASSPLAALADHHGHPSPNSISYLDRRLYIRNMEILAHFGPGQSRHGKMKMMSAGAGLGMGVKDYRVVFVFETEPALSTFMTSGWAAEAQADAAAKAGTSCGAFSGATMVAPGVWAYEITKNGLALQLTLQGTKYSKDDSLNK